jgi:hypothetical protein
MRSILVAALVALGLVAHPAVADDWPSAHPQGWHARGFGKVAEMFPPKSRHNATDKPMVYVYDVAYPGTGWNVSAKLVWKGPLVNKEAPYEAILSSDGWLVTLDDWANLGYGNAVVIYDPKGKLVAAKPLDDLLPADVADRDRSVSSRYWRKGAKYLFDTKQKLLQIQLANAGVIQLSLATGSHKYFAAGTPAPKLTRAEDAEVWPINLRFSSITDVLAKK